jgi:DNA-binding response OmpR family regulator
LPARAEAGADDFIVEQRLLSEVLARIHLVLARSLASDGE